jgi:zinc transport system substrate-binding protein
VRVVIVSLSVSVAIAACGTSETDSAAAVDSASEAEVSTMPQGSVASSGNRLAVYTAFYPLEEATRRIGGEAFDVRSLTPPGVSPHEVELTADVLSGVERSDAVIFLGRGFQPAIEDAVTQLPTSVRRVDLLTGVELLPVDDPVPGVAGEVDGEVLDGGIDPHVWVDPARFAAMAERIADELSALAPGEAQDIERRAGDYVAEINALATEFATGLKTCESRAIVTSHRAFGYLAKAYDLKQLPIAGISPGSEPDPKSLVAVAAAAKEAGVEVVFFESLVPKDLSDTVAKEVGATTDALDPIEGLTDEAIAGRATYASVQRANLASLRKGLRCT